MANPELPKVLLDGFTFTEGPRWHDGRLWFSDFYTHRVVATDLHGRTETIVEVPHQPSGLGWTPDGELLVVSMLDRRLTRWDGRTLHTVADLSLWAQGPCNDMLVDGLGNAYVGNFGFDLPGGETPRATCLIRVTPDGRAGIAAEGLVFPNGTVLTPDGKTLIVGETFGNRLTAFPRNPDGSLGKARVFADLPGVYPDGICLDAEGAVWVADPRGNRVVRVLEGGRIDRTVSTGAWKAYACMLGGQNRRTLFICTSSGSGPAQAAKHDGRIEMIEVEVPGAGLP
jgi:sugar lactone lactonase YvrE